VRGVFEEVKKKMRRIEVSKYWNNTFCKSWRVAKDRWAPVLQLMFRFLGWFNLLAALGITVWLATWVRQLYQGNCLQDISLRQSPVFDLQYISLLHKLKHNRNLVYLVAFILQTSITLTRTFTHQK